MVKGYKYVSFDKFTPDVIEKIRHKGNKEIYTSKDFISLDTETSHLDDYSDSWLYQWCFSYPDNDGRCLVYGRKPSDLAKALKKISDTNKTDDNNRIIIYVHNFSYDYCYIKDAIEEEFGYKGEMIAIREHKILTYHINGLVFKCSYRLSLKSLDDWCKELNTTHKKLKGTINYDIVRFQDSKLNKKDWKYMFYDVICLDEAINIQLNKFDDNLITVPLTNTGYVRRETRKNFNKNKINRKYFNNKKLSVDLYRMMKREFAGGLTHGNRFVADETIKGRIKHRDFASHYPSQQICYTAPSAPFHLYYEYNDDFDFNLKDLIKLTQDNCVLVSIIISNLRIRDGVTLPYAQVSKFNEGRLEKCDFIEDNGRIIKMKSGKCLICVNEYDLKILIKQYKFDYSIQKVYISKRGQFPDYLRETVMKFFYDKTFYKNKLKELKNSGYSEESIEYRETYLNMMIAKGMLNSIYGMTATDPIRVSYYENENGEWEHTAVNEDTDIQEALDKFYDNKNNFMNYELGCWTTSLARKELIEFVELIGYENFLYADTDSIFYITNDEIEEKIEKRNEEFRKIDEENGWFIELDNKKYYFNQFEDENEDIIEFRFLHSKCYAYVERLENNKTELHTTIAGVKKFGRNNNTRIKELGNIENLTSGKVFTDCGGTTTEYINRRFQEKMINGHLTEISSAAIIKPREITLKSSIDISEEDNLIKWEVADIE